MNYLIEHKFPPYSVNISNQKAYLSYKNTTYYIQSSNNPLIFKNISFNILTKFINSFINSLKIQEKQYKIYKDFIYYDNDNLISITKKYSQFSIKKIGLDTKNLLKFINMDILNIQNLNNKIKVCSLPQYFSIDILKKYNEFYNLFKPVEYNIYNLWSIIERDYRIYHFDINKEEELDQLISMEKQFLYSNKFENNYFKFINFLRKQIENKLLYFLYLIFHFLNSISLYDSNNLKKKYFFLLSNLYLNYSLE